MREKLSNFSKATQATRPELKVGHSNSKTRFVFNFSHCPPSVPCFAFKLAFPQLLTHEMSIFKTVLIQIDYVSLFTGDSQGPRVLQRLCTPRNSNMTRHIGKPMEGICQGLLNYMLTGSLLERTNPTRREWRSANLLRSQCHRVGGKSKSSAM